MKYKYTDKCRSSDASFSVTLHNPIEQYQPQSCDAGFFVDGKYLDERAI